MYPPDVVNDGPWVAAYTLERLRALPDDTGFVLPIVPLGTPLENVARLGSWLLPPLYHEALDHSLRPSIINRILDCFPIYGDGQANRRRVMVVELHDLPNIEPSPGKVLAFSVDTAVEEHGPHLPLATDTIQSYSVLNALAQRFDELCIVSPLDYGQLTWGLPFGFSVDLGAGLLSKYVTGFANALAAAYRPKALYVVDIHGSITHRQAIVDGLKKTTTVPWSFRWLHEPLAEFASERGDQHAGGVETALVERVSSQLLDSAWWPHRIDEIAAGQMSFEDAVRLTPDLPAFQTEVESQSYNGVIGDIGNYQSLNAELLFGRMMQIAAEDITRLLAGDHAASDNAGAQLW